MRHGVSRDMKRFTHAWPVINSRGQYQDVFMVRRGEELIALDATCTHAGCQLALWSTILRCGCHGSSFDATTGQSLGNAIHGLAPLRRLDVDVRGGRVFVQGL